MSHVGCVSLESVLFANTKMIFRERKKVILVGNYNLKFLNIIMQLTILTLLSVYVALRPKSTAKVMDLNNSAEGRRMTVEIIS